MATENSEADEEDILDYIYIGCEKLESGLMATSSLIKFIKAASNKTDDAVFHQRLVEHFDKEGVDPPLNLEEFRDIMTSFINSVRSDGCPVRHEIDGVEESSFVSSSSRFASSNNNTSSTASNASVEDTLDDENEDISEKLEHYKSFSLKLTSEKVNMLNRLNVADDQLIQFHVENKALREAVRNHESTKESLQQKIMELEEFRSKLNHYQDQWSECEETITKLERDNQKLKADTAEARNRMSSILKERDDLDDINHNITMEIRELTESKLKSEKNLDLYKIMYVQKSNEYEIELKKYKEMAEHAETLKEKNSEICGKLTETEEKLRHKEVELYSYISQSSLGSIDDEDIPMKLISRSYKSQHFKNKPSLCQELQSSLIESPAFPCPMGELELHKVLALSSGINLMDDSFSKMSFCDENHSEEKHATNLNSAFLVSRKLIYAEELSELMKMNDEKEIDDKINSLSDEHINIVQAKMLADLNCLNLKSEQDHLTNENEILHHEIFNLKENFKIVDNQLSETFEKAERMRLELDCLRSMSARHEVEEKLSSEETSLESGIESSDKSPSEDECVKEAANEKDETVTSLEILVSSLRGDLETQAVLRDSLEKENQLLVDQLKECSDSKDESNVEREKNMSSYVNFDRHLAQNHCKAPSMDYNQSNDFYYGEKVSSTSFERVMSSGDSKEITHLNFNQLQHHQVIRTGKFDGRNETSSVRECRITSKKHFLSGTSSMLWGAIISLIIATFIILGELDSSALITNIVPQLHHASPPPI